jgi:hypothetical protein
MVVDWKLAKNGEKKSFAVSGSTSADHTALSIHTSSSSSYMRKKTLHMMFILPIPSSTRHQRVFHFSSSFLSSFWFYFLLIIFYLFMFVG